MGRRGRERLGTSDEFDGVVDSVGPQPNLTVDQARHPDRAESLGRDTDAAAALVTDPWPLAACAKRVSGPLELQPETSRFICRILARKLISIIASRC
jgi:hypothetical protein